MKFFLARYFDFFFLIVLFLIMCFIESVYNSRLIYSYACEISVWYIVFRALTDEIEAMGSESFDFLVQELGTILLYIRNAVEIDWYFV